jgi:hypothetical protein
MKWISLALIVGLAATFTSCATILRGTGHGIGIASQPPGASVVIDNKDYGVTPVSAKLRRKENHRVVIQLEGYQPYEVVLTRQTSAWVFGNILFGIGAPIGLAIDAISGGMYTLKPDQLDADLRPSVTQADGEVASLYVVLVPKADPGWQKIGQLQPASANGGKESLN